MISVVTHIARSLAIAAFGLALAFGQAAAQEQDFKQIKLTEKHIQGFIAAQKDLNAIADKLQGESEEPDPKMKAELDAIAKKNGFANFEELDMVAANVSMVMAGFDPETGEYTDPVESLKKEIAEVEKDTSIAEKDKEEMLKELREALEMTPPLEHPENVQVVKKYRAEIDKALQ